MNHNALQISEIESRGYEVWNQVLQRLLPEYGEVIFEHWIKGMTFKDLRDGILVLTVKTKFIREWVITNYLSKIRKYASTIDSTIDRVDIQIENDSNQSSANQYFNSSSNIGSENGKIHNDFTQNSKLNPNFTFENFVCSKTNQVAYTAAQSLVQSGYNINAHYQYMPRCLYIHGNVGMGKTHILQSIANHITSNFPSKKVAYLGVERFMNNYINAVRNNQLLAFRENLRSSDILIFDDLQFICDKTSTQKEFTQTFDAMVEANKMIVIASDRPPHKLSLEARIKSRLVSSISVEIQDPDFDLRFNVLQNKAKLLNATIDSEIITFIAEKISSSIRELEGALYRVVSHCSLANMQMNIENTRALLRDIIISTPTSQLSMSDILDAVANFYNLSKADITTKHRFSKSVMARQVSAYLAKHFTSFSLQEIGKKLGGRDHATVIYSVKQIEQKMRNNHSILSDIGKIKENLRLIGLNDSATYTKKYSSFEGSDI